MIADLSTSVSFRATNKKILVNAFQEKVSSRSSFNLANIYSNVSQCQPMITFESKRFQKGCLAAILNLGNFVSFM